MNSRRENVGNGTPPETPLISVEVEFKAATEHFRQDIREFFTRSNFYLVVQTGLLSVFGIRDAPANNFDYVATSILILAGLSLSLIWLCTAWGSVIWINRWREEIRRLSRKYSEAQSYERVEGGPRRRKYEHPEEVTKLVPVVFFFLWIFFAVATLVHYSKILN